MTPFFQLENTKTQLSKFKFISATFDSKDDFEKLRNNTISLVIGSMTTRPEDWDKNCQINIDWIGRHFINFISAEKEDYNKEAIDKVCALCFRFLFEYYLTIKNDLSMEFESSKAFVLKHLNQFHYSARDQIEYAIRDMPIAIFKQLSNSPGIESIKNLSETYDRALELKEKWDSELKEKEEVVSKLSSALSQYKDAFNFVGLYQGFNELSESKRLEQNKTFKWLIFLAILILLPIACELLVIYSYRDNIPLIKDALITSVVPVASFTIISIYYFRVLLFNYKSTKSQILQIDLRRTLCRFIQQYAEYSKEIKSKDHNPLEKFENVIFSAIVSSDEKLPSTYDGLEQLIKIVTPNKS